ncbi:MAG: Crp/Fnr family transcriptional regulator [Leptolyngbyaceae cyanobacterium]|uniref:Crp/Fnr family transcriptional regulator n=1 Tax=Leptodesmis sichuanensis TaxID=2906798 RepID=UPI001F307B01|nr:Crp/Fnr family transcriptional regulator [Leptodesmis sichuanensis]UIE39840.1 Crp/Fnr family transcriptional regulator [Leptodesmis sichuanensis A121]
MLQPTLSSPIQRSDPRQLLEELYQGRTLQGFRAGQAIPMNPNDLWIVCRGVVQLNTLYPNGDEALLGLACPSMPFGLPISLIYPYQAIALSDVDLMSLTLAELQQHPNLMQEVFQHLARRLRQAEAMLAMAGCRRVEDRLRQFLLLLQMEVGQPSPEGTRLTVRLTHQHLASAIGTTRVTVTRLLGKLREEGWLKLDGDRHIILQSAPALM